MKKITFVYSQPGAALEAALEDTFTDIVGPCEFAYVGDSSILRDVHAAGEVTENVRGRLMYLFDCASKGYPDIIVFTCSTCGPVADLARSIHDEVYILRIDEPMAREAVKKYHKIGILGTAEMTMEPARALVERMAEKYKRDVIVYECLAEGAFEAHLNDDQAMVRRLTEEAALRLKEDGAEVILLAQASMAPLRAHIEELTGLPTYATPESCAKRVKELLG